jgi:hypothetical protein
MLSELMDKEVLIVMGVSASKLSGFDDNVHGKIVQIDDSWLKLAQENGFAYININLIKRIVPQ